MRFQYYNDKVNLGVIQESFSQCLQQFEREDEFLNTEFGDSPYHFRGKENEMTLRFSTDFYVTVKRLTRKQEERLEKQIKGDMETEDEG